VLILISGQFWPNHKPKKEGEKVEFRTRLLTFCGMCGAIAGLSTISVAGVFLGMLIFSGLAFGMLWVLDC